MRRQEDYNESPLRGVWWKVMLCLVLITGVGTGVYVVIGRLSDDTLNLIIGVLLAFLGIVIIGVLFIGKDIIQAYIMRRMIAQDDRDDIKQMAALAQLMQGQIPEGLPTPRNKRRRRLQGPIQNFIGTNYRDTIDSEASIELEEAELTYE